MPLSTIVDYVASRVGNLAADKIITEIDNAWREIWEQNDLPGSLWTCFIESPAGSVAFALPEFVYDLRGVKPYNGPPIELRHPAVCYQPETWRNSMAWQKLGLKPHKVDIANAIRVKAILTKEEETPINITIIGPSPGSAKTIETQTIPAGETEVEFETQFTDFISISKDAVTTRNVRIVTVDSAETELSLIENDKKEARYVIIKIRSNSSAECSTAVCANCCYEILFKRPAPTLYDANDVVPAPWDLALQDRTVANLLGVSAENSKQADKFEGKSGGLLNKFDEAHGRGESRDIDFRDSMIRYRYSGHI